MIQIDDAGSGSFVGGTCIGIYRPETKEYYSRIIPVSLYDENNLKKKLYLDAVVDIAREGFRLLDVNPRETVEVCRGYMFEYLGRWLDGKGYSWYRTHITGELQETVENNFTAYAVKLGLPVQYIKYTKYPFHFHKLLRWVFADFEKRIANCKVGWKCWQRIKHIKPEVTLARMKYYNMVCLKCGSPLFHGEPIAQLTYQSNKLNYVYLHPSCHFAGGRSGQYTGRQANFCNGSYTG